MFPVKARGLYIKQEAADDPRSMARIRRMLPFIHYAGKPVILDDAGLCQLLRTERSHWSRHGRHADEVEPVVVFNQFLYNHSDEERARRKSAFPELFEGGGPAHYAGYGGFDWRASGDATYRQTTGRVCQPAYALHSFWGCHFRCAYCNLGHVAEVYVNLEDWAEHIEEGLANLENSPNQKLFQWDNGTDIVCFEPEYGGTRMLIELFARQPDKVLELYVGKSDFVEFMLDYDHRGHTVCCWSLSHETQARDLEKRSASMEDRLRAARLCQEAGYPVRIRFSPMVPTVGWEKDIRHMIRRMFDEIQPEVLTIEPLRFYNYEQLGADFDEGVLDPEFVEAMKDVSNPKIHLDKQFPDELIQRMYRVVFDEVGRISPATPIAFCREKRSTWEVFREELAKTGQGPDNYACNCGPFSVFPRIVQAR